MKNSPKDSLILLLKFQSQVSKFSIKQNYEFSNSYANIYLNLLLQKFNIKLFLVNLQKQQAMALQQKENKFRKYYQNLLKKEKAFNFNH